jgi:hypothetical protein
MFPGIFIQYIPGHLCDSSNCYLGKFLATKVINLIQVRTRTFFSSGVGAGMGGDFDY